MLDKNYLKCFDDKFLHKENQFFKDNSWVLICHKDELKKKNSFITFDLYDLPIILYNFNGTISAFTNNCPHRGSKIKNKKKGNEIFSCDYHGWCFNKDGKFISGPYFKEIFKNQNKKDIFLEKWNLELCGNFIFLSSKKNKINLKSYLGKFYKIIEKKSENYEHKIASQEYYWNCNWKIAIENSIDEYHGPILHKTTFKNLLDLQPLYEYTDNVSVMEMPLDKEYLKNSKKITQNFQKKNISENYNHYLIWPISTLSSTMNNFNFINKYIPIDKNTTKVCSDIYLNKFSQKDSKLTKKFLSDMAIKFNHEVFMEDKIVCEGVQNNIGINKNSIIGLYEERVKYFRNKIYNIK
jgi:phenylpropionate dioxygenase-like ring-hydroxylating dioxygenase large terminal subunit